MKLILMILLVIFVESAVGAENVGPDSEVGQMQEAEKFAVKLAKFALPGVAVKNILITHNKELGAIPFVCSVKLQERGIVSAQTAQTPERACYLAIERAKAIVEK